MKSDFYNANLGRAYPLVHPSPLPDYALADFGCWFLHGATAPVDVRLLTLTHIRLVADELEFIFSCDDPELADKVLLFHVAAGAGRYSTVFGRDRPALSTPELSDENVPDYSQNLDESLCGNGPLWEGYLVLGDPTRLKTYLQANYAISGMALYDQEADVEPALSRDLGAQQLRIVGVANRERTRSKPPTGCREICWPVAQDDVYVVDACLQGRILFDDGHNMTAAQADATTTLSFIAALQSGLGMPVAELLITPDEAPPPGFSTLSGSRLCCETIRSINGSGGPLFLLREGDGVSVTTYPNLHRVVVDFDFHDLAACPDLPDAEDVPCLPPSEDPCECGPLDPDDFECPPVTETTSTTEIPTTDPPDPTLEPGTGSWVLVVCNANSVTDDRFEIRLNDVVLDVLDLAVTPGNPCVGRIFSTTPDISTDFLNDPTLFLPTDVCRCQNVPIVGLDINLLQAGVNSVHMRNLYDNGLSNLGRLLLLKIRQVGDSSVVERVELDTPYNSAPGTDFTASFTHTW